MREFVNFLFETRYWPPRWYCGTWTDALGWTHIISDTVIFASYAAIAAVLTYCLFKIKGLKFERIFILFALFIFSCGVGHLIEAIIFSYPVYRFAGLWKVFTATVSFATVFALIPLVHRLLSIPKIEVINKELMDKLATERKELAEALTQLKNAHQTLEEFSYRIAHDLKEPVRGIRSYATILMDSDLSEESRTKIEKMSGLSLQSSEMIDRILEFATAQTSNKIHQETDLNKVLSQIKEEIADPNDEIEWKIQEAFPPIQGNPVTLRAMLRNLIANGLKYNNKSKKRIQISHVEKNESCLITIQDNGNGISEENKDLLFQAKNRSPKLSKQSGSGFGMLIVKKAMEEHHTEMHLESTLGEGTTISFSLPLSREILRQR